MFRVFAVWDYRDVPRLRSDLLLVLSDMAIVKMPFYAAWESWRANCCCKS